MNVTHKKNWSLIIGLGTIGVTGTLFAVWYWWPEVLGMKPWVTPTGEPIKPPVPSPVEIIKAVVTGKPTMVKNRSVADGTQPAIQQALDEWDTTGPFPIRVNSGARTDAEQLKQWRYGRDAQGNIVDISKVRTYGKTAAQTPHGIREGGGTAIDASPVTDTPENYRIMGEWFESRGFEWGGRFTSQFPPAGEPWHIQMADWKSIPVAGEGVANTPNLSGGLYGFYNLDFGLRLWEK